MTTQITTREYILFAMFAVLTSKIMTMPHVIYNYATHDAIFSVLLNMLIELLLVVLITLLIAKNPDKTFFEFLSSKITKFGATIVIIIISLYLLLKATFILQETYTFFLHTIYEQFNIFYFFAPVFLLIGYMAIKGVRTIGKSLEIFGFFVVLGLGIAFINTVGLATFDANLPYFREGVSDVFAGTFYSSFYIGNSLVLLFLMGKVKINSKITQKTLLCCSLVALFVLMMDFLFYDILGYTVIYSTFALSDLSQFNPFVSDLGHLSWLSIIVGTVNLFSLVAIMLYSIGEGTKQFCKTNTATIPILFALAIMFGTCYILKFDLKVFNEIIIDYGAYFATSVLGIVTILLFILNIVRRSKNETVTKQSNNISSNIDANSVDAI